MAEVFDPGFNRPFEDPRDDGPRAIDIGIDQIATLGSRGQQLLKSIKTVNKLVDNTVSAMRGLPDSLNVDLSGLREDLNRAAEITEQIIDPDRDTTEQSANELVSILESIDHFFSDNPKIDIGKSTLREIFREFERQNEVQTLATQSIGSAVKEAFGKGSEFAKDLAGNISDISRNQLVAGADESIAVGLGSQFLGPFGIIAGQLVKDRDAVVDLFKRSGETIGKAMSPITGLINRLRGIEPDALEDTVDGLEEAIDRTAQEQQDTQWEVADYLRAGYTDEGDRLAMGFEGIGDMLGVQITRIDRQTSVLQDSLDDVEDQQKKTNRKLTLRTVLGLLGKGAGIAGLLFGSFKIGDFIRQKIDDLLSHLLGRETSLGSAIFDMVEAFKEWRDKMIMAVLDGIDNMVATIRNKWDGMMLALADSIDALVEWVKGIPDRIIEGASRVFEDKRAYNAGENRADGSVIQPGDPDERGQKHLFEPTLNPDGTPRSSRPQGEIIPDEVPTPRPRSLESQDDTVVRKPPPPQAATDPGLKDSIDGLSAAVKGQNQGGGGTSRPTVAPGGIPDGADDTGLKLANAGFLA